jgi:small-conductance mechanosensitive channel
MLHLSLGQALALLVGAAAAVAGGRYVGRVVHRALYRVALVTHTPHDERIVLRLTGPIEALVAVAIWEIVISLVVFPLDVIDAARTAGRVGLLVALGWAAVRTVDSVGGFGAHVVSRSAIPLARRAAKLAIAIVLGVMVLGTLGFAIGPVLVVLAIAGAVAAVALYQPLQNVFAAYALLNDHIEGDFVRLETGVAGTIEAIGLYATRIRTVDASLVVIPNRRLADAQIETQRRPTRAHAAVPPPASISYPGGPS